MTSREKAAEELRGLAEWMEESSRHCLTWADQKAANEHSQALASQWIEIAWRKGYWGGETKYCPVASFEDGRVNWHGLRVKLRIDAASWMRDFDRKEPPQKTVRTVHPPTDSDDPLDRRMETQRRDLTGDERREWYRRQALARATVLATLAGRIEESGDKPLSLEEQQLRQAVDWWNNSDKTWRQIASELGRKDDADAFKQQAKRYANTNGVGWKERKRGRRLGA